MDCALTRALDWPARRDRRRPPDLLRPAGIYEQAAVVAIDRGFYYFPEVIKSTFLIRVMRQASAAGGMLSASIPWHRSVRSWARGGESDDMDGLMETEQ